jgi:hypothetical protein
MADDLSIWHVLDAFARRAARRMTEYSSKGEIASELGRPRSETDPLVDQAVESDRLEEDPRYKGFWRLTEKGQGIVDAPIFTQSEQALPGNRARD